MTNIGRWRWILLLHGAASYVSPPPGSNVRRKLQHRGGAKQEAAETERLPTMGELRRFALPALALWISGPTLTLIDTAAVGRSAKFGDSALEIAALGPATSLCDATGFVFAFLNVAATNLLASAENDDEKRYVASRGATLALGLGIAAAVVLVVFADLALKIFIGNSSRSNEALAVHALSLSYARVRALGLPFLLVSNALTAACLGAKDSVSPLKATMASAVANIVGDYLAVVAWRRGVKGAAEATFLAQGVAAAFLLDRCRRPGGPLAGLGLSGILSLGSKSSRPSSSSTFRGFAAPVLVLVFSKIASFGVMTHAAAKLGEVTLAAHQLAFTLYLLASLVLEALAAQTAQAFVPPLRKAPRLRRALVDQLARFAAVSGVFVAGLTYLVAARGGALFTPDLAVGQALKNVAVPLAASIFLHAAVAHGEGVLLATADLTFVGAAYAISALLFPVALLGAIYGVLPGFITSGRDVWTAFLGFQIARALVFQLRAAVVSR